jgi:hypothetical protein
MFHIYTIPGFTLLLITEFHIYLRNHFFFGLPDAEVEGTAVF